MVIVGAIVALTSYPSIVQLKKNIEDECNKSTSSSDAQVHAYTDEVIKNEGFELFSMWGEIGEYEAIKTLIYQFKEENPNVNMTHSATGGGGLGNMGDVLIKRLTTGDYPESFMYSKNFKPVNRYYYPLDDWIGEDKEVLPSAILDYFTEDGHLYAIPLNIHRSNVIWYKPELLQQHNIALPKTLDEFIASLGQLQSKGVKPLIMDATANLITLIGLSLIEKSDVSETIEQIQNGSKILEDDPRIRVYLSDMISYLNMEHFPYKWQSAAKQFVEHDIAFYISGDWSKGYLTQSLQYELGKDFDGIVFPGTEGIYVSVIDAFGISAFINDKVTAQIWIDKLLSTEGQIEFNKAKGSIPARLDISSTELDSYSVQSMHDYRESIKNETLLIIGH